jgi:hypothetical protein
MTADESTRSPVRAGLLALCRRIRKVAFCHDSCGEYRVHEYFPPACTVKRRTAFNKIKTTNRFGLSKLNGPVDIMLPGSEI